MNRIKQPWRLGLSLLACLCLAAAPAFAQDDSAASNAAAPNTDAAAASQSSTNEASATPKAPAADDSLIHRGDVVEINNNAELAADEQAEDVVAVMGSCKVRGHVTDNVVAVFGDVDVNSTVEGDVVSVFGTVHLGPKALIKGDAVSVGMGEVERELGGKVHGRVQHTELSLPGLGNPRWLTQFVPQCVFRLRLLSFHLGWVWGVAGVFFLLYALIAAAFPQAVRASADALRERPVTTLAVGIFGNLGLAVVYVLLVITVVGILAIPIVQVAAIVALFVGKVAIMELIGGGIGRSTGSGALQRPFLAFVLGALIVALIYTIPVLGLLTFLFISAWGFGAATTAAFARWRRERPPKTPPGPARPITPSPAPSNVPAFTMPVATGMTSAAAATPFGSGTTSSSTPSASVPVPSEAPVMMPSAPSPTAAPLATGFLGGPALGTAMAIATEAPPIPPNPAESTASTPTTPEPLPPTPPLPPPPFTPPPPMGAPISATLAVPTALAYPRAGFWIRMAAGALDLVLLIIIGHFSFALFCLCCLAYFTCMITWKGTTIGGIILRQQVVRADGQPLTFIVALVRALAGMFAFFVAFLGFFWIAWDPEKQGWHDKIAGTVVVRLPHSPALLML